MICNVVVGLSYMDYFLHHSYEKKKLIKLRDELIKMGVKHFVSTQENLGVMEEGILSLFRVETLQERPDMALFITSDPCFLEKHEIGVNDKVYYIIY